MDQNFNLKSSKNNPNCLMNMSTFKKVCPNYHFKTSTFSYYQDYLNQTHSCIGFKNNMMLTMNFSQRKMSQLI